MAEYLFLIPTTRAGSVRYVNHFGSPRHGISADAALVNAPYSAVYYGALPNALVAATLDTAQLSYLSSQLDVLSIPINLDQQVTVSNIDTVQTRLEAADIPATWVNVGDTFRVVLREILGFFEFVDRFSALLQDDPLSYGINRNIVVGSAAMLVWENIRDRWYLLRTYEYQKTGRLYSEIEAILQVRAEALAAGLSVVNWAKALLIVTLYDLGYNLTGLNSSTTLRQILGALSSQNANKVYKIGGFVL